MKPADPIAAHMQLSTQSSDGPGLHVRGAVAGRGALRHCRSAPARDEPGARRVPLPHSGRRPRPGRWSTVKRPQSRTGRGRKPSQNMASDDVFGLLQEFESPGGRVWIGGGWGVDALFGGELRSHDDLDIVVDIKDVPTVKA